MPAGAIAAVSGWGSILEGGAFSSTLQSANVPVITNGVCDQLHGGGIIDGMICAGHIEGNFIVVVDGGMECLEYSTKCSFSKMNIKSKTSYRWSSRMQWRQRRPVDFWKSSNWYRFAGRRMW